jgi:hypothetical protein
MFIYTCTYIYIYIQPARQSQRVCEYIIYVCVHIVSSCSYVYSRGASRLACDIVVQLCVYLCVQLCV